MRSRGTDIPDRAAAGRAGRGRDGSPNGAPPAGNAPSLTLTAFAAGLRHGH